MFGAGVGNLGKVGFGVGHFTSDSAALILCTQLYYICFSSFRWGSLGCSGLLYWVIVGCYIGL